MKIERILLLPALACLLLASPAAVASDWATTGVASTTTSTQQPLAALDEPLPVDPDLPAGAGPAARDDARFDRLIAAARERGPVRVLVRVGNGFTQEGSLGQQARRSQRASIASAQARVLDSLTPSRARLLARYQFIPYLALEADEAALATLRSHRDVAGIEEDRLLRPTLASSVPAIGVPQAWNAGVTGAGQTVAILDTGVDKTHPFFKNGKVVSEACYSSGGTSLCPGGGSQSTSPGSGVNCKDVEGCFHGTHVAGIAAGNDGVGPNIGVARDASVIAIQVFSSVDDCGWAAPPCLGAYDTDIIKGLERVLALRTTFAIAAANLSLGGGSSMGPCDAQAGAVKAAIDNLRSYGIATVIATGNEYATDAIAYPACISTSVSVGAVSDSSVVADFSNINRYVSLVAPGVDVRSAVPGGSTASYSGTSMATPHVTGAWAIYKQRNPQATVTEALNAFRSTAVVVKDTRPGGTVTDLKRINVGGLGFPSLPPSDLTAKPVSPTQINLAWNDNSGDETGFKIERKTGTLGTYAQVGVVGANVKTYSNTGLAGKTRYCYRVRAAGALVDSAYSNEVCASTPDPAAIPKAPSNLVAVNVSTTQINIGWTDNSGNESGFKIERKIGASGVYNQIANVAADVKTYANKNLLAGTTYCYRVRAYNLSGNSAYTNESCAVAQAPVSVPTAPTTLTASAVSSTQINIAWNDNSSNETGFKVERKTGTGGTFAQVATVGAGVKTYSSTGLVAGTTYCYRVRAYNGAGNSAYTNEACAVPQTATTVPNAPTGLGATGISATQINLSWSDNSANETGFKIERKTGTGGTYAQIATTGASISTFASTGLVSGTTYCYRVRAYNSAGNSAYSNESCAVAQTTGNTPVAPTGLAAVAKSTTQINIAWNDNSNNETGFKIYRKIGTTGVWYQISSVGADVEFFANAALLAGRTYCYRVRATNAAGDSAYSNEVCATTPVN